MPLFRFVFEEGAVLEDVTPIEFPDHEAAIRRQKGSKKTLVDVEEYDPTAWVVRITTSLVNLSEPYLSRTC